MIRKFNYTQRKKIPRNRVRIQLSRTRDQLAFDLSLNLDGLELPSEARVYLEAWYRTSYMRFACGNVGNPAIPEDRRLTEIDSRNVVHFRLKVVDESDRHHRIVGVADGIRITDGDPSRGASIPLLPVSFSEGLGEMLWNVQFESDGPLLELNQRLESIEQISKLDPLFLAAVYPAAVREIFTEMLLVEEVDPHEEGEDWWHLWLRWAHGLTTEPVPEREADPGLKRMWIEQLAREFAARHALLDRMRSETSL